MDPTDPTTSKFRDAFPYTLLSVSPALAALHSRKGGCEDWCSKCRSYLLAGSAEIQTVHMKKRKRTLPPTRVLRKTCRACGWENDTLIAPKPPSSVSRTSSASVEPRSIKALPISAASPIQKQPAPSSLPLSPVQIKARPKKKPGLQEMLARNRQKTEQAQQKNRDAQVPGGLAAFLNGL
jgi:hypothetical protein